jgi:hypothetical protein
MVKKFKATIVGCCWILIGLLEGGIKNRRRGIRRQQPARLFEISPPDMISDFDPFDFRDGHFQFSQKDTVPLEKNINNFTGIPVAVVVPQLIGQCFPNKYFWNFQSAQVLDDQYFLGGQRADKPAEQDNQVSFHHIQITVFGCYSLPDCLPIGRRKKGGGD